ncbi:MAG: alpha/beta hydrolase [Clostridia bacterium]|nr:alpha/beta hydrolase [Clostridia bacterium]
MLLDVCGERLNIEYIDEGAGDTILLLHGWGARGSTYRCIINMLTPYFRVVAPDMPGFGGSQEPSFPYTAENYAEFVQSFCEKLDIKKAILIGHSHGGRTIIKLVSSEKCVLEVPKIILFDSAGLIRKKSLSQKWKIAKFKIAKKIFGTGLLSRLAPSYIENLRKKNGSADYAAASPVMRKSMVSVINEDLSECLPEISSPTLLIWGENDTDTPMYQAQTMKEKIPDSGLVIIKGGGHFSFLSDPALTRNVLYSFLNVN